MRHGVQLVALAQLAAPLKLALPTAPLKLATAAGAHLARRSFIGAGAAAFLVPHRPASAATAVIQLGGVSYTPAAMLLQLAEQTAAMEGIMRQSAKDIERLTLEQRESAGAANQGPGVVGRRDMIMSIDIMIANSKLESIPNGAEAAGTLRAIQLTARSGKGPLSSDEYLAMAAVYRNAREVDLRRAFEAFGPEEQAEGKAIVRKASEQDLTRMREMEAAEAAEVAKLAAVRAAIQKEGARMRMEPAPPPQPYREDAQARAAMQQALYGK